jgi:hypothetical protein
MRAVWRGTALLALLKKATNSASVTEAMTLAMVELMVWMAPLHGGGGFYVLGGFVGSMGLALKNNVPPARLRAFASER